MSDVESILDLAQTIEGYFHRDEGHLLHVSAIGALCRLPNHAIVELGSYCGKSTVVLGKASKSLGGTSKVYAIDPHEGEINFPDGVHRTPPTLNRFKENMASCGLLDIVELIQKRSFEVVWDKPIALLLIDAFHDYESVSRDFRQFSKWVPPGGVVAFHDYELNDQPGVTRFVNEILAGREFTKDRHVDSLVVLRRNLITGRLT